MAESGSPVSLKFLFANHDGVNVIIQVTDDMLVSQLKEELLKSWPEGRVPKPSGGGGSIRLLTMGKMLDDSKTLLEMRIPKYDHPTPVNVSLLSNGKSYSESLGKPTAPMVAKKVEARSGTATAAQSANQQQAGAGCCVVT